MPRDPWGFSLAAGLVLKEMPFLFFAGLTALSQLDAPRMLGIGASLGYQPGIAWLKLIAPRLYGLIRLPVYAALAYALSAVDMALVLGPTTPPTLAVLAVDLTHDPDLARRFPAAALALFHLAADADRARRLARAGAAGRPRPAADPGRRRARGRAAVVWGVAIGRALALIAIALGVLAVLSLPLWSLAIAVAVPRCRSRLLHAGGLAARVAGSVAAAARQPDHRGGGHRAVARRRDRLAAVGARSRPAACGAMGARWPPCPWSCPMSRS